MPEPTTSIVREPAVDTVVPIVVGAHLEAEIGHRPIAERLREVITGRLDDDRVAVVLTDLWYLNHPGLRQRPTIAVGGPEVNAATAFLSRQLPTALLVEATLRIQVDPEHLEPHACVWGTTPEATGQAVDLFIDRHLTGFLDGLAD